MPRRTITFTTIQGEDWLRAGVLAGFLATFAMSVVLAAAYGLAGSIGSATGSTLQRWSWALVNNPIAERTVDAAKRYLDDVRKVWGSSGL